MHNVRLVQESILFFYLFIFHYVRQILYKNFVMYRNSDKRCMKVLEPLQTLVYMRFPHYIYLDIVTKGLVDIRNYTLYFILCRNNYCSL